MLFQTALLSSLLAISQLVHAAPSPIGHLSARHEARAASELTNIKVTDSKISVNYKTDAKDAKNWIGLYHTTGGPDNEKMDQQSLRWKYAPESEGSVELDTPVKAGGAYKLYFLAKDGYKWLSDPVDFSVNKNLGNEFKVMSLNLWGGGSNVNDYQNKQIKFIKETGVDIIGLQEADGSPGGHDGKRLAEVLGWNFHQPNSKDTSAIISRFPITARHTKKMERSNGVAFTVDTGSKKQAINFWSVHTTADEYGPYELCFNKPDASSALQKEKNTKRTKEITDALSNAKSQIDASSKTPFIFVGDFNAPSHEDWTAAAKPTHCGYEFNWPTSRLCTDANLIDSFRAANPDPVKTPGNTWSPIESHNHDVDKEEPQDRIDFIYHKGALKVVKSETKVVGTNNKDKPDHKNNEWTSDHAAVITTYQLE